LGRAILTAQTPAKTVWDGAYTDAQGRARAGHLQRQLLPVSHADDGGGTAARWDAVLAGQHAEERRRPAQVRQHQHAERHRAGSLSPSAYNDLVALILKSNGFPAGTFEVAPDTVANIQIIPKDGPGELPGNTLVRVVGCLAPKAGADWTITNVTAPQRIESLAPRPTTRRRSWASAR
jgi:hypothetical protein